MRNMAVILVLLVSGLQAQAQPAVKAKAFADEWRVKAKSNYLDANEGMFIVSAYRTNLIADIKKLEDEAELLKPDMPILEYYRALKQISIARQTTNNAQDKLSKCFTALKKANKLLEASDNQYFLGLWNASGNKAVEADIEAGLANSSATRAGQFIDIGYERRKNIDDILKKYRKPMPSNDN